MYSSHKSDFYLYLPSNSSWTYYKDNRPQNFKVKLPHFISLQGPWECALADIQYEHTWYNLAENGMMYVSLVGKEGPSEVMMTVPAGNFADDLTLLVEMNTILYRNGFDYVSFSYNKRTRRCSIKTTKSVYFDFSNNLKHLLGFDQKQLCNSDCTAKYPMDINKGFNSFFIYTDIISPVIVGDTCAPLLKIVPTKGAYGEVIHDSFDRLHYCQLRTNSFDTIEINISDDSGKDVPFSYGKTILKLHFRPKRIFYL